MKKIILAALAAVTLSSPVSALELPDGVTCTDLFWHTKATINKQELTEYDKCIIATNWPEKESGNLANIFWIKLDGIYYSINLRTLAKSFPDKEKAREVAINHISHLHALTIENSFGEEIE